MLGIQGPSVSQASTPPQPRPGYTVNAPLLPIDENIWILIAIGIILGAYFIYKRNCSINKAS